MEFGSFHTTISDLPKEVTIPVVVHVLYKAGSDTKLLPTESDIKNQLNISSKDFRQTVKIEKHEADTKEKFSDKNALDTKISFCLASKDPAGRATSGVLTVPTSVTSWLADDKMKSASTGGSTAWDTEKYLNIWVVNMPDSISAYAQYPGGPVLTDGIVIDNRYFGTKLKDNKSFPYTDGKTLTHLLGNYLNLNDLWSETMLCGDDGVEDTPIHNAPTLGFVDYRFVSTCDGNPVVMSMNYMDNTNDECLYMFTTGQKRRMIVCLLENGARYKLTQSGATQCGNVQALQAPPNVVNTTPTVKFYEPLTCRIYPNPAEDMITFDIGLAKEGETELIVSNTLGNVVLTKKFKLNEGSQQVPINCSQWAVGLYFVTIKANDQTLTERIVINH
jgi:Pregnancy-associated plasma protein-A/Secretion system C-terminal sorting domain